MEEMKWKSHRECTKAIAEDLGLDISQRERMVGGSVYPDKVGMGEAKGETSIFGVSLTYPHHKETDLRIRQILLRLRKEILDGKKLDLFYIGCLVHLIQDRVVFPHAHPRFEEFEGAVAKYKIKEEWRRENIPLMDAAILNALDNILTLDNPNNPEAALKEGYQESLLILKSLLQNPYFSVKFQPIYGECKKKLELRKKTRSAYWLLTYLTPLAPLNAILDRKALANRNIVKKYSYVKRGAIWKVLLSIFAALLCWEHIFVGLICLLSLIGQIFTLWFKVPKELMRNLEWFNFEKNEAKK